MDSRLKFQSFAGIRPCGVCGSRSCTRPNQCDDYAHLDPVITRCGNACNAKQAEKLCGRLVSQGQLTSSQAYLVYVAGEILAEKAGKQ